MPFLLIMPDLGLPLADAGTHETMVIDYANPNGPNF
jgi:hypothetical protein